ncbi:hypothetical protein AOQ88_01435 [Candidatus Riesia sp. GBBU]|nr:hypothetical protein AOQ88_01435 [Candidatus Riesia sp. GBBU]
MKIFVNNIKRNNISVLDRAVQFGDGCFTTILIKRGTPILLDEHILRLKNGLKKLFIPELDWKKLKYDIKKIAFISKNTFSVIKIIISRGTSSGRGYSVIGCKSPNVISILSEYPSWYSKKRHFGINLIFSKTLICVSKHLSQIKHLNRLEQILIKREIELYSKADEAIVLDNEKRIISCCSSNIFWRKSNIIYTPSLFYAGVSGVMRKMVIDFIQKSEYKIKFVSHKKDSLNNAEEIVVTNSLMPVFFVKKVFNKNKVFWTYKSKSLFYTLSSYCLDLK